MEKTKFKIGDKVKATFGVPYAGAIGIITEVKSGSTFYTIDFSGIRTVKNKKWLVLVEETSKIAKRGKQKTATSWTFNAPADYLIDYERIANELSYKHPVAIVKRGKNLHEILIHKSIVEKATALGYNIVTCPPSPTLFKQTCTSYRVAINQNASNHDDYERLGEWLEWVKEVKAKNHVGVFTKTLQQVTVQLPL
jgi:hypothetical protein